MYELENSCCDIIGLDSNGVFGFYRHSATPIRFNKLEEARAFLNYLRAINFRHVDDIYIDEV